MFDLFQSRTLAVSGAALPSYDGQPILTPVRLKGTEKLGELFEYTLELKTPDSRAFSPSIAANIKLDALIGTEVTSLIELEGNGQFIAGMVGDTGAANIGAGIREITGLVSDARVLREEGRSIVYGLTVRPWLWLATKNQDSRLFQDMTVIEITDEVFSAYPFPVEKRLIETYPKRDIQRQHWESDFTFLARIWQEWGVYFWFEHSEGKHRLVLCDSIGAHKPHGPAYRTIRYEAPTGRRIDEEHIHSLEVNSRLTTGTVTTVDYDHSWPRADLGTKQQDPRDTAFANQEHYSWGDYAQPQAGAAGLSGEHNEPKQQADFLALVRAQALRCQGLRASGKGNMRGLVIGQTFNLSHYPQDAANREYVVVSSTLEIENVGEESVPGASLANSQKYRCITEFEIQPSSEAFRLLRTIQKPRTYGPETAVVVGPANQEIWTDAYGRIKVQYLWDRLGQSDERSSCWVRVSSPWQGNQFGAIHLPRIGQEVIVDHLRGDPDLPIVTGRVVNAFQLPNWKLPDNQALSGFRSRELGGGRANHLVMDDTEGKIQAQLSSDEASSQLNLGYITRVPGNTGRQDARGIGTEVRTDGHAVFRAGRGMLVTTEARPDARGHVKDMGETIERLVSAQRLHDALTQIAQQSEAQDADDHQADIVKTLDAQNQQIRGDGATQDNPFPELSEPHLVLAGRAGVEVVTPATVHVAAQQVAITTEGHVGIASGRSLFATVRDTIRIVAQREVMKFVAAAGDIVLQALTKSIVLLAQDKIQITGDEIILRAHKKLRIEAGGSFAQFDSSGIVHGTTGQFVAHAAVHGLPGPRDVPVDLAPKKICIECLLKAARGGSTLVMR